MAFEVDGHFRKAMRSLTSAVSILSTVHKEQRFGMVATSVTSLSMDPPSLLACVNMSASIHAPMLECAKFCVNILHASQLDVAKAFSTRPASERFLKGEWTRVSDGPPYLANAQANIFCDIATTYVHGSHRIIIGEVSQVRVRDEVAPLLYENGHFTTSQPIGSGLAQNN